MLMSVWLPILSSRVPAGPTLPPGLRMWLKEGLWSLGKVTMSTAPRAASWALPCFPFNSTTCPFPTLGLLRRGLFLRGCELSAHPLPRTWTPNYSGKASPAAPASPSQEQLCPRWPFLSGSWGIFSPESGTYRAAAAHGPSARTTNRPGGLCQAWGWPSELGSRFQTFQELAGLWGGREARRQFGAEDE